MKIIFLIIIAAFLVLIPWLQRLSIGINNEVMVDGITTSTVVVMAITLTFSLISWGLFSWASKNISSSGVLLSIISGAAIMIPFLQILGPMAGMIVGVVAGFVAFMFQQKMKNPAENRPTVVAAITLGSTYVVLTVLVLAATQTFHVWDTGNGWGTWTETTEGIDESGFDNVFNNNIGFVFFFAIIPSLIITELIIRRKNEN